jgi:hypothetical protein
MVVNLQVRRNAGNFLGSWEISSVSRRTILHGISHIPVNYQERCTPLSEWLFLFITILLAAIFRLSSFNEFCISSMESISSHEHFTDIILKHGLLVSSCLCVRPSVYPSDKFWRSRFLMKSGISCHEGNSVTSCYISCRIFSITAAAADVQILVN